jgi:Protein of unknown function (DUF2721)
MLDMADYKLNDLVGVAGATIGILIAGGIILGGLNAKYMSAFDRYRALAAEFRGGRKEDARHASLRLQAQSHRLRMEQLNHAAVLVQGALLLFLLAVTAAGMNVVFPHLPFVRGVGASTLFGGLLLIGVALFLHMLETIHERRLFDADVEEVP